MVLAHTMKGWVGSLCLEGWADKSGLLWVFSVTSIPHLKCWLNRVDWLRKEHECCGFL